jgi:hypothetical protein
MRTPSKESVDGGESATVAVLVILGTVATVIGLFTALIALQTVRIGREVEELRVRQAALSEGQDALATAQADLADLADRADDLEARADSLEEQAESAEGGAAGEAGNGPEGKAETEGEPADREAAVARSLSGTWEGAYRCPQGLTGLTLIVLVEEGQDVLATFSFHPLPDNPGVPSGQFAMKGSYSASELTLGGDYWIDRPSGYLMVGLSAPLPEAPFDRLQGEVDQSGCEDFELSKVSDRTMRPPL